jgi:hypothetical protein
VIGAGAAAHGLMVVVAHRIVVSEEFEIRRISLLNVVEAQSGRIFPGRRWGAIDIKARGLRFAVVAGPYRDFNPGEEI